MKKYRIFGGRFDVIPVEYCTFEAENDTLARAKLEEIEAMPNNSWDTFTLQEVVVQEVTRHVH